MTDEGRDPLIDTDEIAPGIEISSPLAQALLIGWAPLGAHTRALLEGAVREATEVTGLGLEGSVAEWAELMASSPQHRALMVIARRAGIPFSEAEYRWRDPEDLAAELAFDAYESAERLASCPNCGVKHEDMVDERGRPLKRGRWKFVQFSCFTCRTMKELRKGLETEKGEGSTDYRLMPRADGDELLED